MKNKNELSNRLGGQIATDAMRGSKDRPAQIRLILSSIALLALIGEEGVQVIFRNNFGKLGLSGFRIIACSVFFGLISFFAFLSVNDTSNRLDDAASTTFVLVGVFYLALALMTSIKGFMSMNASKNSDKPLEFAGESALLSFLVKEGWSQTKVQNFAEPILVLALGIFFSAINLLWGLPLIYCAISVWINLVVQMIFVEPSTQEHPNQPPQGRNFTDVA